MSNQKLDVGQYKTLVFDCDGVVLNSNKIKTQAFYDVAKTYGHEPAQALLDYHVQNGGISRYAKFEYFFTEILGKHLDQEEFKLLLENFAHEVKKALLICEVAEGMDKLKAKTKYANWLIVSGGDQVELRQVFAKRRLDKYFDAGIFGSPDTKDTILAREIEKGNITMPALFIGDSKYDYQASQNAGLDFIFLSNWTEIKCWVNFCKKYSLTSFNSLDDIL